MQSKFYLYLYLISNTKTKFFIQSYKNRLHCHVQLKYTLLSPHAVKCAHENLLINLYGTVLKLCLSNKDYLKLFIYPRNMSFYY